MIKRGAATRVGDGMETLRAECRRYPVLIDIVIVSGEESPDPSCAASIQTPHLPEADLNLSCAAGL